MYFLKCERIYVFTNNIKKLKIKKMETIKREITTQQTTKSVKILGVLTLAFLIFVAIFTTSCKKDPQQPIVLPYLHTTSKAFLN